MSVKSWMVSSLSLALLVGVCLGVIADRVLLSGRPAFADSASQRKTPPLWFICDGRGSLDIEEEPGYLYNERFRSQLLEGLSNELELTAAQRARMESFLEDRRGSAHAFWETSRQAYCQMRDGFRADLRSLLDERQRVRFDAMMADVDRHQAEYIAKLKASQRASGAAATNQ